MSAINDLIVMDKATSDIYNDPDIRNEYIELLEEATAEYAQLQADNAAIKKLVENYEYRLNYISKNRHDEVAIRYALEASDDEIFAALKAGAK
jgi:cell division protein FtsB